MTKIGTIESPEAVEIKNYIERQIQLSALRDGIDKLDSLRFLMNFSTMIYHLNLAESDKFEVLKRYSFNSVFLVI